MPIDLYTRVVLTVIAISLAFIAWKLPFTNVGLAQYASCGISPSDPCYISVVNAKEFSR